MTLFALSYV